MKKTILSGLVLCASIGSVALASTRDVKEGDVFMCSANVYRGSEVSSGVMGTKDVVVRKTVVVAGPDGGPGEAFLQESVRMSSGLNRPHNSDYTFDRNVSYNFQAQSEKDQTSGKENAAELTVNRTDANGKTRSRTVVLPHGADLAQPLSLKISATDIEEFPGITDFEVSCMRIEQ